MKGEDHLIISCTIEDQDNKIYSYTLIDSEATDYVFVDKDFICYYNLLRYKLKEWCALEVINNRII